MKRTIHLLRGALLPLAVATLAGAAGLTAGACGDEAPEAAPTLSVEDLNPASPTHWETRSLADQRGEVTILYFVSYG